MSEAQPAPMSLRTYAKRRGVTAMAVSKAVASGRLKASVVRDARGAPKIADPELADREWEAATDLSKAPGYVKARSAARERAPGSGTGGAVPSMPLPPLGGADDAGGAVHLGMSLADASAAEKVWKARLAELDYRERSGELVNAKEMASRLTDVFTRCRTRLLGIPTRARQQLPHLTVPDIGVLDSLVREALEELAVETAAADQVQEEQEAVVG